MERIRTTLEARIAKEWRKRVERTRGYDNDEDALRREFGSDPEPDESEVAGGPTDTGRRYGQREQQRDRGVNLGAWVSAVPLREPTDTQSQVEETDREDEENAIITTP